MRTIRAAVLAVATGIASLASTLPSYAEFFAWRVVDVAYGDVLNVRAYPSPKSKILVGYPNGVTLSLTGKCTDGLWLDDISGWPAWKQRQAVRYRWCEGWFDPYGSGNYRSGWVYGRYIRPVL